MRVRALRVLVPEPAFDAAVAWWSTALGGRRRAEGGSPMTLVGVRSRIAVRVGIGDEGQGYEVELASSELDDDLDRLVAAGAGRVEDGVGYAVITDPAGLSLRIVADDGGHEQLRDDRDALHLRVLMLDVPEERADAVARFWSTALGGEPVPVGERYPEYTWIRPAHGAEGPINVCVQALHDGGPRMHVDLHCPDATARDAEVARLTAAEARIVSQCHHWVVMRAPGGQLACVVPDAP